jgi:hypothetical protein
VVAILGALVSILEFRVRSRASLELELIALQHQVTVLRRQHRPPALWPSQRAYYLPTARECATSLVASFQHQRVSVVF